LVTLGKRFDRKKQREKRMNNCRHSRGFSLIEVLASCVVLSVAAIETTVVWRLADYKALMARLDQRAGRILREYYELQTFAPKSAKPFTETALPAGYVPQDPVSGFLYHPLKNNTSGSNPRYDNLIQYWIKSLSGSGELTLTYTVPGYRSEVTRTFTKTVTLDPLPTSTPTP
jgi:prepilin-type N-terminal cleavage/methylation domain-containing protein